MLDFLNNNQGLLALLSIIVTIVGFFITNKNIVHSNIRISSTHNSTTDKSGRDINKTQTQKVGKDSYAQQAGRDIL